MEAICQIGVIQHFRFKTPHATIENTRVIQHHGITSAAYSCFELPDIQLRDFHHLKDQHYSKITQGLPALDEEVIYLQLR